MVTRRVLGPGTATLPLLAAPTPANIINSDMYCMDTAGIHAAEDVSCSMSSMGYLRIKYLALSVSSLDNHYYFI